MHDRCAWAEAQRRPTWRVFERKHNRKHIRISSTVTMARCQPQTFGFHTRPACQSFHTGCRAAWFSERGIVQSACRSPALFSLCRTTSVLVYKQTVIGSGGKLQRGFHRIAHSLASPRERTESPEFFTDGEEQSFAPKCGANNLEPRQIS